MIYIDNTTKNFLIPKHLGHTPGPNILTLVNNYTQKVYTYDLDKKVNENEYFYQILLEIKTGLKDGEYTFKLGTDEETYEEGLLTYNNIVVDEMIC